VTMRRARITAYAAALVTLLLCGCDTLPGGTPPAGPLADNTPPPAATAAARHNRRVTALISCALQNGLTAIAAADDAAAAVARDAANVAGFSVAPPDGTMPILRSDDSGIALFRPDGTELWRCE